MNPRSKVSNRGPEKRGLIIRQACKLRWNVDVSEMVSYVQPLRSNHGNYSKRSQIDQLAFRLTDVLAQSGKQTVLYGPQAQLHLLLWITSFEILDKSVLTQELYYTDCNGQQDLLQPYSWITSFEILDKSGLNQKLYYTDCNGQQDLLQPSLDNKL